ncbi:helix-turn-helix transcriptional regulator [Actinoalloteichus sp. GBA129-24]|uniref:helix-turn-helix transcriptional regulator n=1 Tax=Actinoalloteichus sp. GBA129-24 TaxID=1612551 RepID=UPI0009507177|nr:YafY family protein [Actinoalloteichus sp. GBA129-24]APU21060.1 putative transcriptional regulator [Actinoalloteichus sp. GBA129-24]
MSVTTARLLGVSRNMPARMLRLVSLLQSGREWTGGQLAERLGVTDRTVRRDVDRLRALDYPVQGTTGIAGGYRLSSGRNLPPLMLDDDEAVAVAVALRTAAGGMTGIEETAVRALAKLDRLLPARLRPKVAAVADMTVSVTARAGPDVDPATLLALASGCREREVLTFDHRGRSGDRAPRRVEPHRLVVSHGLWYLLAFDLDRDAWRTFRVDRVTDPRPTGRRARSRLAPADVVALLTRYVTTAPYRHTAEVTVTATAAEVRACLPTTIPDHITTLDEHRCLVRLGADSLDSITGDVTALFALGPTVTVESGPPLTDHLRTLAHRLATAVTPTGGARPPGGDPPHRPAV